MYEKRSWAGFYLIVLLTGLSFLPLRSLKFDFNSESFFPDGDPDLVFFQEFREQFSSQVDDEFIFIGLKNNKGIFDQGFLAKADSLSRFISRQDHILKLYSLTTTNLIYFNGKDVNARPLIHTSDPSQYKADSAYLFASPEYRDLLVSKDGRSIAIAAFNQQHLDNRQKDRLLGSIRQKTEELGFDETHITAKIRVERVYISEIEKNLQKYLVISLTLIALVLYILFRSLKAILIPLMIIGVSIAWTLSLISLTGHSLDIISSLLPPILAAICMSDVIHISTHYIEKLRQGLPKQEALHKTYQEIGMATFFTCCTIAAGFLTLGITDIIPIRNFGFFAAAGILLSFGLTLVALYAYYTLTPAPAVVTAAGADRRWNKWLAWCFRFLLGNKLLLFLLMAVLAGLAGFYSSKVEVNSSLLQEIPRNNPMLDDYRFMERDFSGTRTFEMALTIQKQPGSFFQPEIMKEAAEVEQFLKDSCGIGYIISPLSLFRGANKAFHGGDTGYFKLPGSPEEVSRYYEAITQTEYADELQHYLLPDGSRIRISGRQPNLSVKEFEPVKEKIDRFFRGKNYAFAHRISGSALLLDKMTYSLTNNLFTGIFFDALVICIIALLLLRNWIVMLIILIPNVLPLVFMAGMMGLMGINLKADTSVIFAIALGLAVDDSIHFLSRLRLELSRGLSLAYAVKRTYLSTGKAIVITALVLLSGFMTLLASSFGGTFYVGLLISLCLFFAMLLELTLTPLLILLLLKMKSGNKPRSLSNKEIDTPNQL
ncbi:MAG: MMPL family transporter [Sphingobacteriales bacterium]|nr:MMPL family transporter [Sphingobacteriales bacterium]